ncbi:MAG: hypothetical protein QXD48_00515 [Candidatus Aenigmatarchaeota archaeon]
MTNDSKIDIDLLKKDLSNFDKLKDDIKKLKINEDYKELVKTGKRAVNEGVDWDTFIDNISKTGNNKGLALQLFGYAVESERKGNIYSATNTYCLALLKAAEYGPRDIKLNEVILYKLIKLYNYFAKHPKKDSDKEYRKRIIKTIEEYKEITKK